MEEALAVFSADGRMPGPQCDNPVEGGGHFFFLSLPSNLARHPKGSSRLSFFFYVLCVCWRACRLVLKAEPALWATGELLNEGCRTTGALFSATQTSLKGIVTGYDYCALCSGFSERRT